MNKCMASLVLAAATLVLPGVARADTYLWAWLDGASEVPPVQTPGYGFAYLYLPDDWSYLYYYVEFSDLLAPATQSHIHAGPAGSAGRHIFYLSGVPRATAGSFEGILTAADFSPSGSITSYEQAIVAMMTGGTYINVHSVGFPGGEIRGQTYLYEEP